MKLTSTAPGRQFGHSDLIGKIISIRLVKLISGFILCLGMSMAKYFVFTTVWTDGTAVSVSMAAVAVYFIV